MASHLAAWIPEKPKYPEEIFGISFSTGEALRFADCIDSI
jgi:hypothetical protein